MHKDKNYPQKPFFTTWLISNFFGVFGLDRFYLGYRKSAFIKLITLGGLGLWAFTDILSILLGRMRSADGKKLSGLDDYKWFRYTLIVLNVLVFVAYLFFARGLVSDIRIEKYSLSRTLSQEVETEASAIQLPNRVYIDKGRARCRNGINDTGEPIISCDRYYSQIYGTDENLDRAFIDALDQLTARGWSPEMDPAAALELIRKDLTDNGQLEGSGIQLRKGELEAIVKFASPGIKRLSNYGFCDFLCKEANDSNNQYNLFTQITIKYER